MNTTTVIESFLLLGTIFYLLLMNKRTYKDLILVLIYKSNGKWS